MDYRGLSSTFFENVPGDFFSILSSPNRELYLAALFVVRDAFEDELVIGKKELREQLLISLENSIAKADLSEDVEEGEVIDKELFKTLPGKASFLLGKLIHKGWLCEEDSKQGFERDIVMPDYASDMLEVLYRETRPRTELADSDVFSTYAVLSMAEEEDEGRRARTMSRALKVAAHNAGQLSKTFRNLYYYIGKYYKEHADDEQVREMLEKRFKEGGEQSVIDAYYHPLKTSDSIALYGGDILRFVRKLEKDPELIRQMAKADTSADMEKLDEDERILEIRRRIDVVYRTFSEADNKIDMITDRNADYNRRFTQAVIHNLRSDNSIVSKIVRIMKGMEDNKAYQMKVRSGLGAVRSTFVDERSLRTDTYKPEKETETKMLLRPHHKKDEDRTRDFLKKSFGGYTMNDARSYVKEKMHGRKRMETGEIIKEMDKFTEDDYTLLIMASLYGFSNGEYNVQKSGRHIEAGSYSIPDMTFTIKESGADS